jgi:hypothetical protein
VGGESTRSLTTIRRDVYRLLLEFTRMVIDPLVAGQLPGVLYNEPSGGAGSLTE